MQNVLFRYNLQFTFKSQFLFVFPLSRKRQIIPFMMERSKNMEKIEQKKTV